MLAQFVQAHIGQGFGVRTGQDDGRRDTSAQRFDPAIGTQAPAITGFESGKAVLGSRRHKVVALGQ